MKHSDEPPIIPPPGAGIDALKQQPLQLSGEQFPFVACMHPPAMQVPPLGQMVHASPFEPQGSVGAPVDTTHLSPRQHPWEQLAKLQLPEPLEPPELVAPLEPAEPLPPLDPLPPPEPPELVAPLEPLAPLELPAPLEPLTPLEPPEVLAPIEASDSRDPKGRSSRSDEREQPMPDATPRAVARTKKAIRTEPTMADRVQRCHSQQPQAPGRLAFTRGIRPAAGSSRRAVWVDGAIGHLQGETRTILTFVGPLPGAA
jgi:hypothetical protein